MKIYVSKWENRRADNLVAEHAKPIEAHIQLGNQDDVHTMPTFSDFEIEIAMFNRNDGKNGSTRCLEKLS